MDVNGQIEGLLLDEEDEQHSHGPIFVVVV